MSVAEKEMQKIDEEFQKIQGVDDVELTTWQRQIKVNKFMVELEVRGEIARLVTPISDAQKYLQDQLETELVDELKDLQERFVLLEQHVYGKPGPETRFETIENRQNELDR